MTEKEANLLKAINQLLEQYKNDGQSGDWLNDEEHQLNECRKERDGLTYEERM